MICFANHPAQWRNRLLTCDADAMQVPDFRFESDQQRGSSTLSPIRCGNWAASLGMTKPGREAVAYSSELLVTSFPRKATRELQSLLGALMSTDILPPATEYMEAARRALDPAECALIVIDIQEKLLPPIFERERVVKNSQLLIRAAGILNIPTIATTQYAKGLGETVPDVKSLLPSAPIDKQMFSCFGSDAFCSTLKGVPHAGVPQSGLPSSGVPHVSRLLGDVGMQDAGRKNTLLLCGMESHICVTQTALAALREGYMVHVASDAVSSRTPWNLNIGLDRMRAAGAVISSTEMIIYELLHSSATEEFKRMLAHLK